jgi:hypothetical protein
MQWIDKDKVEQLICIYVVLGSSLRFSDYIDRSIAVCLYIIFTWYIYEMMKQLIVFSSARNLHRNVQEGQGNQMTVSHIAILCLYQLYYIVYNNDHSQLI